MIYKYCIIYIFSSAIILFIYYCCNFSLDFLCLVSVASVVGFGISSVVTSGVVSATGWRVGISSKLFIGNNLFSKLIRAFSLALNNNRKLSKKDFFSIVFVPFSKLFNSLAKLPRLRSAFLNNIYPSCAFLKKAIRSEYSPQF